jgi:lactate permease
VGQPAIAGASAYDARHEEEIRRRDDDHADSKKDVWEAFAPYIIIIAVFSIAQWGPIKDALDSVTKEFEWPGLDVLTTKGEAPSSLVFKFNWANAAGTLLFISGLLTMLVLRVSPGRAVKVFGKTLVQMKLATITVMSVLALAYVMNQSAQTLTIGNWIAGAGGVLAFFSSIIGWLGVAVTGSDTSSNSLFGVLQQQAATKAGIDPLLLTAGNSSGGVLGKMVSPQNLAIGAAAVGLAGREGDLFRKVLGWSLLLLLIMCILVYLQSTSVLGWMIP